MAALSNDALKGINPIQYDALEGLVKQLIMCQGLPGSGKSTWALLKAEESIYTVRVNKDDIRAELGGWSKEREPHVQALRDSHILDAFGTGAEVVISDDTNFARQHKVRLEALARSVGARLSVKRFRTPIEECIERDSKRAPSARVGRAVIEQMVRQYHLDTDPAWYGLAPTVRPYTPQPGLPSAIICDLDGTLALFAHHRSPYDASTCAEDRVNLPVLETLVAFDATRDIVLVSGREEKYRPQTVEFLEAHNVPWFKLYMRATGDKRKDWIVKAELFDRYIRDTYDVRFVLDDRNQVVKMWRQLGLTVFQVADGDF